MGLEVYSLFYCDTPKKIEKNNENKNLVPWKMAINGGFEKSMAIKLVRWKKGRLKMLLGKKCR